MSVELMGAVFYLDLPANRKLILLAMADNASDAGVCWPSQDRIAVKASLSTRRTRDHIHTLVSDGWATLLESGKGGGGKTNVYRLNVDRIHLDAEERRAELTPKRTPDTPDVYATTPDGGVLISPPFPSPPPIIKSSVKKITPAYERTMIDKYAERYGSRMTVELEIKDAYDHPSSDPHRRKGKHKKDDQLWLNNWLRRGLVFREQNGGTRATPEPATVYRV